MLFSGIDQTKPKSLILRSVDERDFQILDVKDDRNQVSTAVVLNLRKLVHRLDVTLKVDRKANGPHKLVIRTDHPDQRVVEVPYIILETTP